MILSDEVVRALTSWVFLAQMLMPCCQYDCLTLDGKQHVRIAALDDFWRRTVTVGSAVRSFLVPPGGVS